MKVDTKREVNKYPKSFTTTVRFEQVLPQNLLGVLAENGITHLQDETPLDIDIAYIKEGVLYGTISSTTYP